MSERWPAPTPPGWFPDAGVPGALRYWNGVRWTDQLVVADGSQRKAEPFTPLPMRCAIILLVATAVSLTADKVVVHWLIHYRWPIAVYIAIAACIGYLPLVITTRRVLARHGTGNAGADIGLRFRRVDLGWGPLTWIACFQAEAVIAAIILAFHIPLVSNTQGISDVRGNHTYIISFAIVAVLAAPVVEELVFRGMIMRGFRSQMPTWLAVGLQGILFGAAHIDPERGMGNIGLVMILSAVGIVLGGAAYLTRRLAPTMIAHGLFNTVAMIVLLTR